MRSWLFVFLLATTPPITACARPTPAEPARQASRPSAALEPAPDATAHDATDAPAAAIPTSGCGELDCRQHVSVTDAIKPLLEKDLQVLAFGEAHAQSGTEHIPSTARRFTENILPLLAGSCRDLVLELMVPNPDCQAQEKQVVQRQQEVTRPQAAMNQNEYVLLAQRAKELGIQPHILRPSCEQYEEIIAAGADDISVMLRMTADLTASKVKALLGRNALQGSRGLIVTYGGLMHNDPAPREGHEAWSFGPALERFTRGKYLAVDLIVREYVKDTAVWQALPWTRFFTPDRFPDEAVSFAPAAGDLVVIYPRTSALSATADHVRSPAKEP